MSERPGLGMRCTILVTGTRGVNLVDNASGIRRHVRARLSESWHDSSKFVSGSCARNFTPPLQNKSVNLIEI